MSLHKTPAMDDRKFTRISRSLIERAMEMRGVAYLAHAKHALLVQTLMNMNVAQKTLLKSNEDLRELDRIKTMFIAGMSHELNNPLVSILGYSELLARGMVGPLNKRQQEYLQNVIDSAEHLKGLVADAMDIAKIESNVVETDVTTFSLRGAVDEAVTQVQAIADEKNLGIRINMPTDIDMLSDRRRLIQCLLNLLTNAIKYTNEGHITIQAQARSYQVQISVSDTGVGLSSEDVQHLFDAFCRGGSAKRTQALGSGIGLFLTNKLVHNVLHGSISVDSQLDKGSTFSLCLPISLQ